ncbi:MAG: regulator of protease activity HflC (stomatin/prohibitin superfamily) [Bacteroidia bacterium]|jgi:regulator of protease activity HflC (stomatin/prohibitin superfamily)
MDGFGIGALAFLGLAIITVLAGAKLVPQGYNWTVERFGRYTKTLKPGLNIIVPYIDRVGEKINMMEVLLDIPPQEVISSDNAMVRTDAVCFFQVQQPEKAAYEVNDRELAMQNLVMTNIRAVLGSMELDHMLSRRDVINAELLLKVDEATNPWGIKVTRIEIRDITPPQDLVEAMGRQMKAERLKRAQILEAEGHREAAVQIAEGDKRAKILEAEGQLEAAKREAEARERLAEAEARATQVVSAAIDAGNSQAINYFIAIKYTEALGQLAASNNNKVMMIPLEAGSLIGALGGISEIIREASDKSKETS